GGHALEGVVGAREVSDHALLGGGGPEVAAGFDDDALACRRNGRAVDVLGRIDGFGAEGGLGAGDGHADNVVFPAREVEEAQFGAELEDDLAAPAVAGADAGPADIVVLEGRDLLTFAVLERVGPDVEAVLGTVVGEVVDGGAVALALAVVAGGDPHWERVG